MTEPHLSATLRARYSADLLDSLQRIDSLESERTETRKLFKELIEREQARVRFARDVLAGKAQPQATLPGIDTDPVRQEELGAVLRHAVAAAERICQVTAATETQKEPVVQEEAHEEPTQPKQEAPLEPKRKPAR